MQSPSHNSFTGARGNLVWRDRERDFEGYKAIAFDFELIDNGVALLIALAMKKDVDDSRFTSTELVLLLRVLDVYC